LSVINNAVVIRFLTAKFSDDTLVLGSLIGEGVALLVLGHLNTVYSVLPVLALLSTSNNVFSTITSSQVK